MEEFINIFAGNPWLIANCVLMLAATIFASILIMKYPGVSLCLILASILGFGSFVVAQLVFNRDVTSKVLRHFCCAAQLAANLLLYVAVFGWRSRSVRATLDRSVPVRIPVGWVTTLTILPVAVLVLPIPVALLGMALAGDVDDDNITPAFIFSYIAVFAVGIIVGIVLIAKILYRGWMAIQDEYVRTTPGKAVGFLFMPFFNLYWLFVAWGSFAGNFNAFISRYGIPVCRLSESLFITHCVLILVGTVVSFIPIIGLPYILAPIIIQLVVLWSITRRVNDLCAYLTSVRSKPRTLTVD